MLEIGKAEAEAASRVITRGQLFRYGSELNECTKFERELAEKMGTKHALVVTSGTAALICALAGLEVGPGDEVILPAYTFMASALAPLALGAIPVIAEIDESLTLDPEDVEKKISSRTKVIMPVHMVGLPCDMRGIMRIARRHEVKVVEDACQADGGSYRGKRLGAIGDVGAFSFNYYKNITCGEGGAVITDDRVAYERALIFHDGGAAFRPGAAAIGVPFFAGFNFRMNEILAAVLRVQLRRIDGLLKRNRANKARFLAGVADHPRLRPIKHNDLEGECATVVGFLFADEPQARRFMAALSRHGVGSSTPIDSGRHVYRNWEPIMERRGSYHPALDAFRRPENKGAQMEYSPDMCPRTLDILARTVFLNIRPEWKAAEVRRRAKACCAAADELS
jgi:dTDP-4-amino-4,6-dideoxygalactose transaminase